MRIGCLQWETEVGRLENNIHTAERVLEENADALFALDLLVLPEMALTGYNFTAREEILPFLEVRGKGRSYHWAKDIAARLQCMVSIGYPEQAHACDDEHGDGRNYNATMLIDPEGTMLAQYRKCTLFPTDTTWASPSLDGFCSATVTCMPLQDLAIGICMDLNARAKTVAGDKCDFAEHVVASEAQLVLLPMAWTANHLEKSDLEGLARYEPDEVVLDYWITRFKPVVENARDVVLVLSNKCGAERSAVYTGTSVIMKVGYGRVDIMGIVGMNEESCLVVDTECEPHTCWDQEGSCFQPADSCD